MNLFASLSVFVISSVELFLSQKPLGKEKQLSSSHKCACGAETQVKSRYQIILMFYIKYVMCIYIKITRFAFSLVITQAYLSDDCQNRDVSVAWTSSHR